LHIPVNDRTPFEGLPHFSFLSFPFSAHNHTSSPSTNSSAIYTFFPFFFLGLVQYIENTVRTEKTRSQGRPIYIAGESIGACLALAVAARNIDTDLVLVLVNPGLLLAGYSS
jgi:predicted alpha/beta-fold hydrolase